MENRLLLSTSGHFFTNDSIGQLFHNGRRKSRIIAKGVENKSNLSGSCLDESDRIRNLHNKVIIDSLWVIGSGSMCIQSIASWDTAGEWLGNQLKFSKNQDADIANGESSNDGRKQGKGECMRLMADWMIRGLAFKNSLVKQEKGKVEQKSPLEGVGRPEKSPKVVYFGKRKTPWSVLSQKKPVMNVYLRMLGKIR
jgi:hypothetical protein